MPYDMEALGRSVDRLEDAITDTLKDKKDSGMNDIAGLLALMQGNRGMDLPGLMALCKEKGYDRAFGGEGMFMFVFLILFLFAGGGWNRLNGNQQADFAAMAGNNCQEIIGIHDRISAAQAASTQGFQSIQTWLCESIANVTSSIRNQGDRAVDATRNVGDTVRDCCCKLEAALATLNCKVDGVDRSIRESTGVLAGKIDISQERTANALQSMECRLSRQISDTQTQMALGFERQACLIRDTAKDQELARLTRENEALRDTVRGDRIAEKAISRLETFAINHYTPTRTAAATPA